MRKPRFSRHFSKKREDIRYLSHSPRAQAEDKSREITRSKSPEPEPEPEPETSGSERDTDSQKMGVKSRRSSDSSVVSSPFKVLPPILNVSEDSDKERENDSNRKDDSASHSNDDQDHDEISPPKPLKVVRYFLIYRISIIL